MISNLKRLKFKAKILNFDAINFKNIGQYDFIILDSPCSAVGTIRKNPEIFFRTKQPNFDKLIKTQKLLLDTASKLLKKNGIILYMVCSFLKSETDEQIYKFLEKNKNFSINKFFQMNKSIINNNFIKDNKMITLPSHINDFKIDGYFATYLRKDK